MFNARAYASTHVGRRANNEDSFRAVEDVGLYVVADGMGGYEGGEVASRLAVDTLADFFSRIDRDRDLSFAPMQDGGETLAENMMGLAIRLAHREIAKRRTGELARMGSTLAAMLLHNNKALIAHVGDSRVYRYRDGEIDQLTRDHSLYADMVAAGVKSFPTHHSFGSVLTRAVGVNGYSDPDMRVDTVESGDIFVLCSDGLSDMVEPHEIADILRTLAPYHAVDALVAEAYGMGGQDNITALLVAIE